MLLKWVAGLGTLGLATLVGTGLTPPAREPGRAGVRTPLELFRPLLPVVTHPRCVNCHGGVDPLTGRNHGGGVITPGTGCNTNSCHEQAPDPPVAAHWHQPDQRLFFAGKNEKELCAQYADFVMHAGPAQFIDHLQHDALVGYAFAGLMAGARDTADGNAKADPPPMVRRAFVDSGTAWLNDGHAACDVEGTITQLESVHSDFTRHRGPNVIERMTQNGSRSVTLTRTNGGWQAKIETHGGITTEVETRLGSCVSTAIDVTSYDESPVVVPVSVEIKDTVFDPALPSDYRIDVTLPFERMRETHTPRVVTDCPTSPPALESGDLTLDWPEWTFTIEGHVKDPAARRLVGGCDKMVKMSDVGNEDLAKDVFLCLRRVSNQEPWLMNHGAAVANPDGSEISFRMTTTWNIAYR